MAQQPWLVGIVACALSADAVPVRGELRRRRLQLRSVPAGRARAAWTCAAPAGTIALVVSGSGIAAARQAAGFWMPRARRVAVAGTAIATPMAGEAAVILDGDAELAARASGGPNTAVGRIATVRDVGRSEQVLISLGRAGIAAVDREADAWRQAAAAVVGQVLVCGGVADAVAVTRLARRVGLGEAAVPWWRRAIDPGGPDERRRRRQDELAAAPARAAAARAAVTALLGPG
ncbi:MAG: hypothetical protein E6J14_07805 [Chloroflexi bacterium]|nr:MAG: hypothetical protein E6J14_07805 [Chloroflexota bacterium]